MDKNKVLLGKILGELYRLQNHYAPGFFSTDKSTIYGLLNGIETVIDDQVPLDPISAGEYAIVNNILFDYSTGREVLHPEAVDGHFRSMGIDRSKTTTILRYMKAAGFFEDVIDKISSGNCPSEYKTLEIPDERDM